MLTGVRSAARTARRPLPAGEDSLPGEVTARLLAGGARLALYREPAQALVAVRVSFPLSTEDGPPEALARMAQGLAQGELERQADAYGARVSLERSPTYASFAITGAATDFDALVAVLRRGLAWGGWSDRDVETARLVAESWQRQRAELPEPLLRRRMAARLFPGRPARTDSVPPALTAAALHHFWARFFVPARMRAVVVGGVTEAQAVAALAAWPAPSRAGAVERLAPEGEPGDSAGAAVRRRGTARADTGSVGRPQVLFPWAALGWSTDASPAVVSVAARLVQARLAAQPVRDAHAELWWTPDRSSLVVLASAAAASDSASVARALATGVSDVAAAVTGADAAAARLAVARDILFSARTPEGLARFLGELFDRTGDPAAGQAFLRALGRVSAAAVEGMLRRLGEPVTAAVVP